MSASARTSLAKHPEIAQQVGLVVAEYALLERLLFSVYALLANDPPLSSFGKFYRIHSFHQRKLLITATAKNANLNAAVYSALMRLLRRFGNAADRRAEIAHCAFLADHKAVVRLVVRAGNPKYEKTSRDIFARTFTQYNNLGMDLMTFQAFVAGSSDRALRMLRSIPRAPDLEIPQEPTNPQDPATRSEAAEVRASLSRLGLIGVPHNLQ
jgi:hypothetical protein